MTIPTHPALTRRSVLGSIAGTAALGATSSLWAQETPAEQVPVIEDMVIGSDDAPVTIIEYASLTCPHCATFHSNVFPTLRAEYVDTCKVRFVYREVYFDRLGLWGTLLARCDDGARYFGIVDMLFANQRGWVVQDPTEATRALRQMGARAGLSGEQMDACFTDGDTAAALVARYQAHMEEHPISGTPSFVINGEMRSNMSLNDFRAEIDRLVPADFAATCGPDETAELRLPGAARQPARM